MRVPRICARPTLQVELDEARKSEEQLLGQAGTSNRTLFD